MLGPIHFANYTSIGILKLVEKNWPDLQRGYEMTCFVLLQ